jgi:hypothetical protein
MDLYPTNTPSTRLILKRTRALHAIDAMDSTTSPRVKGPTASNAAACPAPRRRLVDAVEGKAVGCSVLLVSTSVEVCVARAGAGPGVAPVA